MSYSETCFADPTLYLLADATLVEECAGVTCRLLPLEKHPEPVLRPIMPWEGGDGAKPRPVQQDPLDGSVLYDPQQQLFHLWYRTHNNLLTLASVREGSQVPPEGSGVCYATSRDGLHWERPALGRMVWEQSTANNMVPVADDKVHTHHLSGVVPNYVPGLEGALVGTIYSHFDDPVYPHGITFLTSPDGLSWKAHYPPPLPLDGDAHCLMYDWHQRCYLCTTRSYAHSHEIRRLQLLHGQHQLRNKRHIAVARSRDLVHWTPMLPVLEADNQDAPNAEFYSMSVLPYGHGYLRFLQVFWPDPTMTYGPLEMQLTFSRDLLRWQRVGERAAWLPRCPRGAWDQAHVVLSSSTPHPEGDRLRFWYGGKDTEHWQSGHGALGTGTMRRDGFVGYSAGAEGGTLTTAPMQMTWATKPFVSADAAGGEIRVEILDAESRMPLEGCAAEQCQPITADGTDLPVVYGERRGSFVRHTGRIRLRFHLRQATLYAFKAMNVLPADHHPEREKNLWL